MCIEKYRIVNSHAASCADHHPSMGEKRKVIANNGEGQLLERLDSLETRIASQESRIASHDPNISKQSAQIARKALSAFYLDIRERACGLDVPKEVPDGWTMEYHPPSDVQGRVQVF